MVFFTCSGCGESVKKAQVEKHRWQCRRSQVLTCIDCNKDFRGDEYQSHMKCISEDQKYGGQNYVGKANKGEVKQEKWFEQVQRAIDSSDLKDARLRSLLIQVKNYSNVPRKQQKFESFLTNSLKVRDRNLVSAAWAAISASVDKEKEKEQPPEITDGEPKADEKESTTVEGKKRKNEETPDAPAENGSAKKRKLEDPPNDDKTEKSNGVTNTNGNTVVGEGKNKKFNWRKAVKQRLISADGNQMKLKKLRKEIIAQYKTNGNKKEFSDEDLKILFDQAIERLSVRKHLEVDEKLVRVVEN